MLLLIPAGIRKKVTERIRDYCKPFAPYLGGKWPAPEAEIVGKGLGTLRLTPRLWLSG